MDINKVPENELKGRMNRLKRIIGEKYDKYIIIINSKVNMYYMTGTMQDGVLVITQEEETLWVRRSVERANLESNFGDIEYFKSFREISKYYGNHHEKVFLETKTLAYDYLKLMSKHFDFDDIFSVSDILSNIRSIKSDYEIDCMKKAGAIHQYVLEKKVKDIIRHGVSEAQLAGEIYTEFLKEGCMGIARFNMPAGEDTVGLVSFAESSLVKTAFDGPGGTYGTCCALQCIGSNKIRLDNDELIFIDIPSGIEGYHTDKSVSYYFGDIKKRRDCDKILDAYNVCLELENYIKENLKPGVILGELYQKTLLRVPERYKGGFMNGCRFLGHSLGLTMDEMPVIADGFGDCIEENMIFAIEPKIALYGIGVLGDENTYIVKHSGAQSLTGQMTGLVCL